MTSEEKIYNYSKEQFGKLGLYLINKARREINNINQETVFQKAEIKRSQIKKKKKNYLKIKRNFINSHAQFLNKQLSSTLLEEKERFLNFKNNLIKNLKINLRELIKEKIGKNYQKYEDYLLNLMAEFRQILKINIQYKKSLPNIILQFNSNDFNNFNKKLSKIENILKTSVEVRNVNNDIIGGFKAILSDGIFSFDYTIDNLIKKNSAFIEREFIKIVSDYDFKVNELQFEEFIKKQELRIKEFITKYDRI